MAKLFSSEFQIDGVNYLLESGCEGTIWPQLCRRVFQHLERIGKKAAEGQFGERRAEGKTTICKKLVSFKLTINPSGNKFG